MFARQDMSEGELIDDIECLGGLELLSDRPPIAVKKSLIYTFRYAEQETKLRAGIDCCRTDTMKHFGEIIALDEVAHEVQIKVGPGREIPPRFSIGPKGPININAVRDAVWRFADALLKGGDRFAAIGQFLRKVPPRLEGRPAGSPIVTASSGDLPDRGIFLGTTWRMHGDICRFISDAVYDGRLEPEKANSEQRLVLDPRTTHSAPRATGIRFVPVVHEGCAQKSDEEAQVVREILQSLLAQRVRSKQGHERAVTLEDVLVVAPYNAQVNHLKSVLPAGARVGTIDKFQGQQAEVVIVSLATSSGDYLPRNIEFLYSKNRLNVAVSRAKCLAIVVASPALLGVRCNSVEEIELVNPLCWLQQYADAAEWEAKVSQ